MFTPPTHSEFLSKLRLTMRETIQPAEQAHQAVYDVLSSDLQEAWEEHIVQATPRSRRSYIRALAALFEGTIYGMKQVVLARDDAHRSARMLMRMRTAYMQPMHDETFAARHFALVFSGRPLLSDGERAFLREKMYRLKDNGEVHEADAKVRFLDNLCFAFMITAKQAGVVYALPKRTSVEWKALVATVDKRDDLTHPKSTTALVVQPLDLQNAQRATEWFVSAYSELQDLVHSAANAAAEAARGPIVAQQLEALVIEYQQKQERARSLGDDSSLP